MTGGSSNRPRRVGEVLDGVARRLGAPEASSLSSVFSQWDEVVGPAVAAHARPHGLADGVLVVEVDDPAWATQLGLLETDIRKRLNGHAGDEVVRELRVRVVRTEP